MPKNLSELNVLIADDEADICSMVKFALQALGISKKILPLPIGK